MEMMITLVMAMLGDVLFLFLYLCITCVFAFVLCCGVENGRINLCICMVDGFGMGSCIMNGNHIWDG